jgi:hypothetical protein
MDMDLKKGVAMNGGCRKRASVLEERGSVTRSNVATKHASELPAASQCSAPRPETGVTSERVLEITRTRLE